MGDRGGHFGAHLAQPVPQPVAARGHGVPGIHHVGGESRQVTARVDVDDLGEVIVADHRVRHHDLPARGGSRLEQVLLGTGGRRQRGYEFFPDRVQRRVGHLGEELGEVVEDQPWPGRQRRHRGVGAHRTDRLGAGTRHRGQQDPQLLLRVAEHPLLGAQVRLVRPGRDRRGGAGQVVQVQQPGMQPFRVRMPGGQRRLDLSVLDDPALAGVGQEDPPRLQSSLPNDGRLVDLQHADFAGQHDEPVVGHPVPARAQPVAVQDGADHGAVGERHAGRPVPRLHQRGVEPVERTQPGVHLRVVLPRFRDHHEDGLGQRPAGQVQQLQARVEAGRVALLLGQHGEQPVKPPPVGGGRDQPARQHGLAGAHPVAVAPDRVDLAVVRHEPVRVRERPGRERVRREPGMHESQGGDVAGIRQVRVERPDLGGGQHPLVHDGPARQAGEVEPRLVLGALAQAERAPVELDAQLAAAARHEQLAQPGQQRPRPPPARRRVVRDLPPAEHAQPFLGGNPLHCLGRGIDLVRSQEGDAGRVRSRCGQRKAARRPVEAVGNLGQDACPVAGVRVAALRTPVVKVAQDGQALGHDVVAAPPGQVGHEADAARVMLELAVVQAPARLAGVQE